MTEIKRYVCDIQNDADQPFASMFPEDEGNYVTYDDHAAIVAALQEQVRALAAENAALKHAADIVRALNANPEAAKFCGFEDWQIDSAVDAMTAPATDGYFNSVRAEGVEMFAKELGSPYGDDECREYETGFNRAIEVSKSKAAKFVTQLRAGKDGE